MENNVKHFPKFDGVLRKHPIATLFQGQLLEMSCEKTNIGDQEVSDSQIQSRCVV